MTTDLSKCDPLLVDCYQLDGPKDWLTLARAGLPWIGATLKATQGTYYAPSWFADQMKILRAACPERNGFTWFFGGYHYLDMSLDGTAQADYFLAACDRAGLAAKTPGLLWPMVDVERGGQRAPSLTKQRVEDVTGAFALKIIAATGRQPTLYGGELLNSLGITSPMGCGRLAIARYAATLPHDVVTRIGWPEPWEWQFCGDGESYLHGYPNTAPGCGRVDISAVVAPGGVQALAAALR